MTEMKLMYEKFNSLNMYCSIMIILFGVASNLIALRVLIFSRRHFPKINCIYSLMFFVITNLLQLFTHFHVNILSRVIYYFSLENTFLMNIYLFETNTSVGKILAYLKYLTRFLNLSIILNFSIERAIDIYFPYATFTDKSKLFILVFVLLSFIMPSYFLVFSRVIQKTHGRSNSSIEGYYDSIKISNIQQIKPFFNDYLYSIEYLKECFNFKFFVILVLFTILSYLLVSILNFAILFKLKKKEKLIFHFNLKNSKNFERSILKKTHSVYLSARNKSSRVSLIKRTNLMKSEKTKKSMRVSYFILNATLNLYVNQKFHNTKMLLTLSASLLSFNLPYILGLIVIFVKLSHYHINDHEELLNRAALNSYLAIAETFQLINVSLTGLLLFLSGKIFRRNFKLWLTKSLFFQQIRKCSRGNSCF
jgi:hypothetical protein